jgi:hypothetical protein
MQSDSPLMDSKMGAFVVAGLRMKSILHTSLDAFEVAGHCTNSLFHASNIRVVDVIWTEKERL